MERGKQVTTTTWADGFGRWHVTLPQSPLAEQDALNALSAELTKRENMSASDAIAYLERNMIRRGTSDPELIEYIEYGIEADLY